ncbi:MAG: DUF805 domain-containing protein [Pseudomonadota bacterium]
MTDLSPIDPERPWIDDPRDAPAAMQWLPSLFDPFGETARLHFTRGWTVLFFTRLLVFLVPVIILSLFSAAGASDPGAMVPPNWFFPLVVLVTALMSAVLHMRRLNDARRSPLWAVIVLVPVMFGMGGLIAGAAQGTQQYQEAVDELNNPAPPPVIDPVAEGEDDAAGDRGEGRGERGDPLDVTEVSAREHAVNTGLSTAQAFWAIPSFIVMLWSLLWVGRLPNGGGLIRDRVAQMEANAAGAE